MNARSDCFPALCSHQPALDTNSRDKWIAFLAASLLCLSLLASALLIVWLSLTPDTWRVRPRGGSLGISEIQLVGGEGAKTSPAFEIVSPEDEQTDASITREMISLLNQLDGRSAELVDGVPGEEEGRTGTGPGPEGKILVRPRPVPPSRWIFRIDRIATTDDYARLLDDVGIELGTFDDAGFVYLRDVSKQSPVVRRSTTTTDGRFYTRWQSGTLAELDYQLLQQAGIVPSGPVVHFFGKPLEDQLTDLEIQASRSAGRRLKNVRRTWFGVSEAAGRFEFFVLKQQFKE